MARPRKLKPNYCQHKPSGRAFVTLNGQRVYLGDYGTQASRDEYDRIVGEWIAARRSAAPSTAGVAVIKISGKIHAFWEHACTCYGSSVRPDVKVTGELDNLPRSQAAATAVRSQTRHVFRPARSEVSSRG